MERFERGGAKKMKLLKHMFALQSSSRFLKKLFARYDRSIAFYHPIKMQACNVNFQCPSLKKTISGSQLFFCTDASANRPLTVIAQNLILYKTRRLFCSKSQ